MSTEPSIIDQDTITTYAPADGGPPLRFEGSDPRVLRTPGCCCVVAATECGVPLTPEHARHLAGRLLAAAGALDYPPGIPERALQGDRASLVFHANALRSVLDDRERELLEALGPCRQQSTGCRLHYRHSGPCDFRKDARK